MSSFTHIQKVLVVDDDVTQTKIVEKILTNEGCDVVTSNEASEGLQIAMDTDVDLIVLDVMMPIINGYNFCQLLKAQEHKKDTPIILATSRDDTEDIEIGLEMGANAYIIKPVVAEELIKAIKVIEGNM